MNNAKKIEENNIVERPDISLRKLRDIKGIYFMKRQTPIQHRNSMDISEAKVLRRGQEYTRKN